MPTVDLAKVSGITSNSAISGGNVTSDGGATVTAKGVCWGTNQDPTTSGNKTANGAGTGSFTSTVTGLDPGAAYYIRAYATNEIGTAYNAQDSFKTAAAPPALSTTAVSDITSNSATSGGNITRNGGSGVTVRGVCWATTENPTVANTKTDDGSGAGAFTSRLTGMARATTYYINAYATNNMGTAYGGQDTITTLAEAPTVATTAISAMTNTTASSGGTISCDGGSAITAKGVCWASGRQTLPLATIKRTMGQGTVLLRAILRGLLLVRLII